ncbi:MAG TPA: hypothetical protein PKA37_05415 [Planctomycetota bacterium]|jgi:hypothetical protein|nr:hypothetical protein [Planctomycetota bacterium]
MKPLLMILALSALVLGQEAEPKTPWELLQSSHDKNKDGKISLAEYDRGEERFRRLDTNGDGVLTTEDFADVRPRGRRGNRQPGGRRGTETPRQKALEVGAAAPDFHLPTKADPKKLEKLSSYQNKKPVALIFGSYT